MILTENQSGYSTRYYIVETRLLNNLISSVRRKTWNHDREYGYDYAIYIVYNFTCNIHNYL